MAKFAVGEIAEHTGGLITWETGEKCEILAVGPCTGSPNPFFSCDEGDYIVVSLKDGSKSLACDKFLRKLPPDDKAQNTTEDPGLTLIKKLLEQDTKKEKEHA